MFLKTLEIGDATVTLLVVIVTQVFMQWQNDTKKNGSDNWGTQMVQEFNKMDSGMKYGKELGNYIDALSGGRS